MLNIIGIDPGLSGAIAYLTEDSFQIWDMPVVKLTRNGKSKKEVDEEGVAEILEDLHGVAYIEKVGAMPGQGVTGMFSFGQSYGAIRGVCAGIGISFKVVPPATWKAKLKVRAGKAGSALAAQELFKDGHNLWHGPRGGLLDGRVEAVLIAYYGRIMENE